MNLQSKASILKNIRRDQTRPACLKARWRIYLYTDICIYYSNINVILIIRIIRVILVNLINLIVFIIDMIPIFPEVVWM